MVCWYTFCAFILIAILCGSIPDLEIRPPFSVLNAERERELRREGGKSLLAYVKGVDPYLIHIIDRPNVLNACVCTVGLPLLMNDEPDCVYVI